MKKIITISREYGSGGRFIAKNVAEKLNYAFYDKELIDMAAQESGLSPEFIAKTEQNLSSGWLYSMMIGSSYSVYSTGTNTGNARPIVPLVDQIFNAQRKVIIKLAEEKNCVIVGRCADYILSSCGKFDKSELLNIFIYGDLDDKIEHAVKYYGLDKSNAGKMIIQIDKRRANHYNTFTENTWGDRKNYDLLLNSSCLGFERTVDIICSSAQ